MTTTSPTMVKSRLMEIHASKLEDKLSKGLDGFLPWEGGSPMLEKCGSFLNSKKHTPMAKAVVQGWVTGGWWTADRQLAAGYLVDPYCPHCPGKKDTIHHRLYACSITEELRSALLTEGQAQEAKQAGPKLCNCLGWLPRPMLAQPALTWQNMKCRTSRANGR